MGSDEEFVDKKSNKQFLVPFLVLCVVIVGLIVGIVVAVNNKNNQNEMGSPYDSAVSRNKDDYVEILSPEQKENANASSVCDQIQSRYFLNSEYTYEDAVAAFESSMMESTDVFYKMTIGICYANFVDEQKNDSGRAIEILENMNSEVETISSSDAGSYYSALAHLYEKNGNSEMANYYGLLIQDSIREGTAFSYE